MLSYAKKLIPMPFFTYNDYEASDKYIYPKINRRYGFKRPRKSQMKKRKQLSLAQALGNLSKVERDKLIGLKVVFECFYNNRHGSRTKKRIQKQGTVIELQKSPGFVLIEDETGGLFSRALSQIWGDVV